MADRTRDPIPHDIPEDYYRYLIRASTNGLLAGWPSVTGDDWLAASNPNGNPTRTAGHIHAMAEYDDRELYQELEILLKQLHDTLYSLANIKGWKYRERVREVNILWYAVQELTNEAAEFQVAAWWNSASDHEALIEQLKKMGIIKNTFINQYMLWEPPTEIHIGEINGLQVISSEGSNVD